MKFIGIIPARYASTRFPGKPLAMLDGKPVIQHVYEKVASCLEAAYVATDDERIFNAVEAFGGKAVMTRKDHKSGTDRIEEAIEKLVETGMSLSMFREMNLLLPRVNWKPSASVLMTQQPKLPL